jgi:putative AbiEii toxin of type IV toxin-antitoxin system/AAA ATPase-like protein
MTLLLDSLRIENYRTFRHLEIERLGRATLVVGKNNSGKSSVLEAVRLFASRGDENVIWSILQSHDETRIDTTNETEDRLFAVKQLFHGRDTTWEQASEIRVSATAAYDQTLSIQITTDADGSEPGRLFMISTFAGVRRMLPLDMDWLRWRFHPKSRREPALRQAYVSPYGMSSDSAAKLWDLIALTDLEEEVIAALRIISPEVERISFIGEGTRDRIPVAKLRTLSKPVPLRSLGDGVDRMLGIALSLVSARGGVLLLDEVENGIHFSAQHRLWELIFQTAHRLNTQVFATTHSWDCIQAFQSAAADGPHEEAALVRLDLREGSIEPTTISERDLSIVTRDQIEVR